MTRKRFLIGLLVTYMVMQIFGNLSQIREKKTIEYSNFYRMVENSQVEKVEFVGENIIKVVDRDGNRFITHPPPMPDPDLLPVLREYEVAQVSLSSWRDSMLVQIVLALLPLLLILLIFMIVPKQINNSMMNGRGGPMGFGRNRARMYQPEEVNTTFADVAGVDEAREDVQEVVDFLKNVGKFEKLGGHIPHGVLMVGPPGTGKTLLARAIAGEAGVPFFSISGSDFVEMFVGVGASRVRDMFAQARKSSPCIVFIDEIDAVGRQRGAGLGGGHDEREQTLNQLLVEMDGFGKHAGVIVIAATNRPDVLDKALLRPGRFDRQLVVNLPDLNGRLAILKVHTRKLPLDPSVDLKIIARGTTGFSGADLSNLMNESALMAARENHAKIGMSDIERAKDKIIMGAERRSMVVPEKEKVLTAYHESGHAIIGRLQEHHHPVHKVTIIPRGHALGVTVFLPKEDQYSMTRKSIISQVRALFGGRAAEELIYGKDQVTTGASNDIRQATELVRNMVSKWGLSDEMGPLLYDDSDEQVFLGRSVANNHKQSVSGKTAENLDVEIRRIIDECYDYTYKTLKKHRDTLELMAQSLMKFETLNSEQLDDIMDGKNPKPVVFEEPKVKKTKSRQASATKPTRRAPPKSKPGSKVRVAT